MESGVEGRAKLRAEIRIVNAEIERVDAQTEAFRKREEAALLATAVLEKRLEELKQDPALEWKPAAASSTAESSVDESVKKRPSIAESSVEESVKKRPSTAKD